MALIGLDAVTYAAPMTQLVLASASPARLATLRAAGIDPVVQVSSVDEAALLDSLGIHDPQQVPLVLAQAKAQDVARSVREPALVVGCDSILEQDGVAIGKPADPDDAIRRWQRMRGHSAVLRTGHWVIDLRTGALDSAAAGPLPALGATSATVVTFAHVTDAEIEAYVATGEPLQVAGSFTIDGLGGAFVTGVQGDHHGVVGISLPLLRELTGSLGVPWPSLWRRSLRPEVRRA
jgi:septum formation protein